MRLLFDQNLSHRLLSALDDLFPSSLRVRLLGLAEADDLSIWNYAKEHQLIMALKIPITPIGTNSAEHLPKSSGYDAATHR